MKIDFSGEAYDSEIQALHGLIGYNVRIEFGERLGPRLGFRTEDVQVVSVERGDNGIRLGVKNIDEHDNPQGYGRVVEPTLVYVY